MLIVIYNQWRFHEWIRTVRLARLSYPTARRVFPQFNWCAFEFFIFIFIFPRHLLFSISCPAPAVALFQRLSGAEAPEEELSIGRYSTRSPPSSPWSSDLRALVTCACCFWSLVFVFYPSNSDRCSGFLCVPVVLYRFSFSLWLLHRHELALITTTS